MLKSLRNFISDESAQGMTEYILLIVAVITILFIFKDRIKGIVEGKMETLKSDVDSFQVDR